MSPDSPDPTTEHQTSIILETTLAVFELRIDLTSADVPFYWCWRRSTPTPKEPTGYLIGPFVSEDSFRAALLKNPLNPAPQYRECLPPPAYDWLME